jgi:DNA-directed RNA polymerase specialized sigma24 family protein
VVSFRKRAFVTSFWQAPFAARVSLEFETIVTGEIDREAEQNAAAAAPRDAAELEVEFSALLGKYYRHNARRLERIWSSKSNPEIDVLDVVAECFRKVFERYKGAERRPRNETELDCLMTVAIRNHILDILRGSKPTISLDAEWVTRDQDQQVAPPKALESRGLSPEDAARLKILVRRALEPLKPEFRASLDMFCIQGYTPQEVGKLFGVNGYRRLDHCKTLLFRVLDGFAAAGDSDAAMLKENCSDGPKNAKKPRRGATRQAVDSAEPPPA